MSFQSLFLILTFLAAANPINDFNKIAKANALKKEAKEAYNQGDFEIAANKWQYLLDSMQMDDDKIRLNLANAKFNLGNQEAAIQGYNQLTHSKDRSISSVAHQQLGINTHKEKQYEKALDHFKKSLKADPTNEASRYNYELLKKLLKDQEEEQDKDDQNDQDQDQDQDQNDQDNDDENQEEQQEKQDQGEQENQEEQDKNDSNDDAGDQDEQEQNDGEEDQSDENQGKSDQDMNEEEKDQESSSENELEEEGEAPEDNPEGNFEDMPINEEAAKMILEAMKNQEIQYIQQNKRNSTKRPDPKKPDW